MGTKKHKEAITEEIKMKELMEKNLKIKEAEIKKQRSYYGEKMKDIRAQLDEVERNKAGLIRDLAASENIRKELVTKVKALEKDKKEREPSDELKNELNYWKDEAGKLRNKLSNLENLTTQETSPIETFMDMDESMFSTLTESRVQEDLSTTGGLGGNEGMDTTVGHADPEEMDTSSEPKTQRKKRRMEAKQADTAKEENPGKGKGREEVKLLEATVGNPTNENPTTSMAEEIERLKEQHILQLEEHQLNSERTLERIKKSMEEKMEKDKSDMAKEVQEMRK